MIISVRHRLVVILVRWVLQVVPLRSFAEVCFVFRYLTDKFVARYLFLVPTNIKVGWLDSSHGRGIISPFFFPR